MRRRKITIDKEGPVPKTTTWEEGLEVLEELKKKLLEGPQGMYIFGIKNISTNNKTRYRFQIKVNCASPFTINSILFYLEVWTSDGMVEINGGRYGEGEIFELPEDLHTKSEENAILVALPKVIYYFWKIYYTTLEPKQRTISRWWREVEIIQEIEKFVEEKKKTLDSSRAEGD